MERELIVHDGSEPLKLDYVRVVCVSDTHCRLGDIKVPMGDILIHTGDFTLKGTFKEVKEFVKSLNKLPHLRKLVIGGNHDLCMDYTNVGLKEKFTEEYINKARSLVSASCIYLQDSGVQLFGYNIWGTPWIPKKNRAAFTLPRNSETLAARRSQIPVETDILMTLT